MQAASDYKDIFGADNFYLELMDHGLPIERLVREGLLNIGRQLELRPIATNDSHYVTQDQADSHAALLCVQAGNTLNDPNRFKFDGDGYYLKSSGEMRQYWDGEVPGVPDNTLLIAERVESYEEVYSHKDRMPVFEVPEGYDQGTWLHAEVMKGLKWRFPDGPPDGYPERIEYELGVIIQKGFPAYFLVVADLIGYARSVGIRVGPGRGSATGPWSRGVDVELDTLGVEDEETYKLLSRGDTRSAGGSASRCCRRMSTSRLFGSPPSGTTSDSGWARCATSVATSSSRSSRRARRRGSTHVHRLPRQVRTRRLQQAGHRVADQGGRLRFARQHPALHGPGARGRGRSRGPAQAPAGHGPVRPGRLE
jgi:hypothetical protein